MLVTVMACACQEEAICKNNVKYVEINVLKINDGIREGSEAVFVNVFFFKGPRNQFRGIDSASLYVSVGARNRVRLGLSYRPARLHRLAEFIPWNRFLCSINVLKYGLWRIDFWVSGLRILRGGGGGGVRVGDGMRYAKNICMVGMRGVC